MCVCVWFHNKMEVKWLQLVCLLAAVEWWSMTRGQRSPPAGRLSMPGSPSDLGGSDRRLLQVVLGAARSFNSQSNDAFLFRPSSVRRAQRQIVKGLRYIVDFNISRTVCRKRDNRDLVQCSFQPAGRLRQTLRCHADVWTIPWKQQSETLELLCGTSTLTTTPPSPGEGSGSRTPDSIGPLKIK